MRIQKNPDSVLIADLNAIPPAYKHVKLMMPAYVWAALLARVGEEEKGVRITPREKSKRGPRRMPSRAN
jgi:hypothetical protein